MHVHIASHKQLSYVTYESQTAHTLIHRHRKSRWTHSTAKLVLRLRVMPPPSVCSLPVKLNFSQHTAHIVPHALRSNRAQIPWCPFWGSIVRRSILVLSFCVYNNDHGLERKSCECGQESAPSIQRVHGGGEGPTLARITYSWMGGAMHANNIHLVF